MVISVLIFILIVSGLSRGMKNPIRQSGITLLLPIIYIATCLFQLLDPDLHAREDQIILALVAGLVIAVPLVIATNFEIRSDGIYFQRSSAVFVILIVVFALRFALMGMITGIDSTTLEFILNVATLSYIAVWRIAIFAKLQRVVNSRAHV